MNKAGRLLEPRGSSVPPERTDAEAATAPVTNDEPAHTQMWEKSLAEPQAWSIHLQSPPEMVSTWFGLNSKMPFQLPHYPHIKSCVPLRGPSSIRVVVLHHITQFCIHAGLLPSQQVFNSTSCVWVYFCISVHRVHAVSTEARRKHGIPWGWGHRQL